MSVCIVLYNFFKKELNGRRFLICQPIADKVVVPWADWVARPFWIMK
jgi:hypothetical protein